MFRLNLALLIAAGLAGPVFAQNQTRSPHEYIESTSPLPGGGVVTSVLYPGQPGALAPQMQLAAASTQLAEHRVLSQPANQIPLSTSNQATGLQPINPVTTVDPRQVPTLGVPTNWNVAMRPGILSHTRCAPSTWAPAATLPPALPQATAAGTTTMVPPTRALYTPLVSLRNMPPNVYAGQGIIGSPKLYVDGQPIRNLLRYLIIP